MIKSSLREDAKKIQSLMKLYDELQRKTVRFKKKMKMHCLKNCGQCCSNPDLQVSVLEWLPLAIHIWKIHETDIWLKQIGTVNGRGPCIFYRPDPSQKGKGCCSVYRFRPLVCRLHGFSAVKNKYDQSIFTTCAIIKKTYPEKCREAQGHIDKGFDVPVMQEFTQRLIQIDMASGLKGFPINKAAQLAMERIGLVLSLLDRSPKSSTVLCHFSPYKK